jgi:transglutaminase-like putative cysteine protease
LLLFDGRCADPREVMAMKIRCGFDIGFDLVQPTPMLLMLSVRPERFPDLLTPQVLSFSPSVPSRDYVDAFGNQCTRVLAPAGAFNIAADFLIQDPGLHDEIAPDAAQHPVEDLPDDVLVYLLGSRYCDTDHLTDLAWKEFGNTPPGWARVQAIVEYTHNRITFGYQHACATRTASGGHREQIGVCRDFAHLAITLCRCMNIPARYCNGYLGDIGVPRNPAPMDFNAWFEVYLGGRWHTFDARHNERRIGRIVIARGRDAMDIPMVHSFGPHTLGRFEVVTEEVEDLACGMPAGIVGRRSGFQPAFA